jgi:hypothetical protein
MLRADAAFLDKTWGRIHRTHVMEGACSALEGIPSTRKTIATLRTSISHAMEGKVCQPFIKTVKAFLAQDAVSNVFSHFLRVVSSSRTINWLLDADRAVVSDWAYFSFDSTILAVVPWLAILALFDLAGTWLESKHAVRTILRF